MAYFQSLQAPFQGLFAEVLFSYEELNQSPFVEGTLLELELDLFVHWRVLEELPGILVTEVFGLGQSELVLAFFAALVLSVEVVNYVLHGAVVLNQLECFDWANS